MDREKADGVQDDARSTRPALANRPEPNQQQPVHLPPSVRLAPPGQWPRSRRPTRTSSRPRPRRPTPSEDIQPFAIGANGRSPSSSPALNIDPADAQAANDAVGKALEQLDRKTTNSGRAVLQPQGAANPSGWSPCSSIPPSRWPSNCIAAPTAPTATSSPPTPPRTTTSACRACPARPPPGPARAQSWPARSAW